MIGEIPRTPSYILYRERDGWPLRVFGPGDRAEFERYVEARRIVWYGPDLLPGEPPTVDVEPAYMALVDVADDFDFCTGKPRELAAA